ncbi:MAG: hypothetical protein R6U38_13910 [Desulfatiglandaceae bacterium]
MKALVCGAGQTTDELLKRLGESWQVILFRASQLSVPFRMFVAEESD